MLLLTCERLQQAHRKHGLGGWGGGGGGGGFGMDSCISGLSCSWEAGSCLVHFKRFRVSLFKSREHFFID